MINRNMETINECCREPNNCRTADSINIRSIATQALNHRLTDAIEIIKTGKKLHEKKP
jgi:hypothetical protein